jgi:hypothetical protein
MSAVVLITWLVFFGVVRRLAYLSTPEEGISVLAQDISRAVMGMGLAEQRQHLVESFDALPVCSAAVSRDHVITC